GIQALVQIDADGIARIERASDGDQDLRKVGVDPPVTRFVGIGQRGARHVAAEAHVIEFGADGAQACFDVAQALAVGQLGERHGEVLIPAGQIFQVAITRIAGDALLELLVRKELDQLGKDCTPGVHPALSLRRQGLAKNAFGAFLFQIVLAPKRMYRAQSKSLALSRQKFPRTAVSSSISFICPFRNSTMLRSSRGESSRKKMHRIFDFWRFCSTDRKKSWGVTSDPVSAFNFSISLASSAAALCAWLRKSEASQ